ncbi:major facilitator superfamily domain-containing protein [Chlamydoabsidia padenii]|nr:major facilitator superfamily domain-containing protein [Chlamydoabsidia padenii]
MTSQYEYQALNTGEQTSSLSSQEPSVDPQLEARLIRKLDTRLLPFLSLMYLFSSLDRSSLGNAVLDNFEEDVHITPDQFNSCVTIFYVGFLLFQIPSNILLKRFTAKRWLPLLMFVWGTMATLHATASSYSQLMAMRFFLGLFESGFFPGVLFYLTLFYKKREMATRIALFWGSSVFAHAFAGILAFGILQLRGSGGLAGWQWLFLIEGIPTMILAVVAVFYLPASPGTWLFLTEEERSLATTRLESTHQHFTLGDLDSTNKKQAWMAVTDGKVWLWMFIFFCGSVPNTSVSNFLPTIVKGMGYNDKLSANLMSAPPYLFAMVVMILGAYSSDRRNDRSYHAIAGAMICLIGYILLLFFINRSSLYVSVCVAVAGIFVINPVVNAWLTSNMAPEMKRSVATAMAVSANNAAGLIGSNIYRASDSPRYLFGHTVNVIFLCVFITLVVIQRLLLARANRNKSLKTLEGDDNSNRIGDRSLDFVYSL